MAVVTVLISPITKPFSQMKSTCNFIDVVLLLLVRQFKIQHHWLHDYSNYDNSNSDNSNSLKNVKKAISKKIVNPFYPQWNC